MKLFITSFLLFLSIHSFGQNTLSQADNYFDDYKFEQCIPLYLDALTRNDVDTFYIKTRLAESYRKTDNLEKAGYWYSQLLYHSQTKPIYYFYSSLMLQSIGSCDSAKVHFDIYETLEPDEKFGSRIFKCPTNQHLEFNLEQRLYEIQALSFNSTNDELGISFYKNDLLFSTLDTKRHSKYARIRPWSNSPFFKLYKSKINTLDASNYQYSYDSIPQKMNLMSNSKYHDFDVYYDSKNSRLFFTRNNLFIEKNEVPQKRNKIFHATLQDDKIVEVYGLPFNSDEYSVQSPFITADGTTLYFASDMPGGFGGFDIYKSTYEKWEDDTYQWSPPMNLGANINTEFDEISPYLNEHHSKLYFSSNRSESFGGYDIFYFYENNDKRPTIVQLPKPLNSDSNETDVIINEEDVFGYIVSNRVGGKGGYDIYSFLDHSVEVEVLVYNRITAKPMPNIKVYSEFTKDTLVTNKMGRLTYYIPINTNTSFEASKDSFITESIKASTEGYQPNSKMFVKIPITKDLDFNLQGRVIDDETSLPLQNVRVILQNDCDLEFEEIITDENGNFSFSNLGNNCCFRVLAQKEPMYFLSSRDKICTRGQISPKNFDFTLRLTPTFKPLTISDYHERNSIKINLLYHLIIKDENNKPIPNLNLTLRNLKTNRKIHAQTNAVGEVSLYFKWLQDCSELIINNNIYNVISEDEERFFCPYNDLKEGKNEVTRTIIVTKY